MGRTRLVAVLLAIVSPPATFADIVLENPRLRAVLGADASWRSFVDKSTGDELCAADQPVPLAVISTGQRTYPATTAQVAGDRLILRFAGCDTQLTYTVSRHEDWLALRLVAIAGTRPARVTLAQVGVKITAHGGPRLNVAWDERQAVCLRDITLQGHGVLHKRRGSTLLSVLSQDAPGPRLEGAGAALIVAPTVELKPILSRLAAAYDLPRNEADGVASRDLPSARQSYWFLSFGERDVDRVIDYCRRSGLRQVMMGCDSWCASVGHFTFRENRYPDGLVSLRRTVAKLHEHGILVGMHTFASKIAKRDTYVTPVPNRGFWVDRAGKLSADVGPGDALLRTASDLRQWPGSPVCQQKVWEGHVSKHQDVILDDEIVHYESIGPEGRWDTFQGCQRGAYGTKPAAHAGGTECRHYGVDGCIDGYIVDQQSPLFDEMTSRLAHVFNDGDFDMVYFDGSEDVDTRRFDYFATNAHVATLRKFRKRPLIHMGGGFTHGLWHSFTRSGTVDQYPGTYLAYLHAGGTIDRWPTCKDHIDRSVQGVLACEADMTPGELGWFGIGPKSGNYDGLQYDEIEYLMCKSLAYNAPISLQTSFARMESHPLTPDILAIIRRYEQARLAGRWPAATIAPLRTTGKDFVMLPDALSPTEQPPEFIAVERIPQVAGTADVRAFFGARGADAFATVWHYLGKRGRLLVDHSALAAYDVAGRSLAVDQAGSRAAIPLDGRRLLLHFRGATVAGVRQRLAAAVLELEKPMVLWLPAKDYHTRVGAMKRASEVGVTEPDAFGDAVLCAGRFDTSGKTQCYCEYRVAIPWKGRWTLWARVRYPTGGDMSFGLVRPNEPVTLTDGQVLGNCGVNATRWHWTGRGGGVSTVPPGVPIAFHLDAGEFAFRIYPREGDGTIAGNPRLDCFCLSDDPAYRPTDADARAASAAQQAPGDRSR